MSHNSGEAAVGGRGNRETLRGEAARGGPEARGNREARGNPETLGGPEALGARQGGRQPGGARRLQASAPAAGNRVTSVAG